MTTLSVQTGIYVFFDITENWQPKPPMSQTKSVGGGGILPPPPPPSGAWRFQGKNKNYGSVPHPKAGLHDLQHALGGVHAHQRGAVPLQLEGQEASRLSTLPLGGRGRWGPGRCGGDVSRYLFAFLFFWGGASERIIMLHQPERRCLGAIPHMNHHLGRIRSCEVVIIHPGPWRCGFVSHFTAPFLEG